MPATRLTLPRTDLAVSPLCLGANRFGAELDRDASFALLDAFVATGGNFIDSAGSYADWHAWTERSCSEKMLGRWLAERKPADIVVATKGGHPREGSAARLDAATLRADALASRDNLGVAAIDLFYVHRDEAGRPLAEVLETLEALRAEGVLRWYAASNFTAPRLAEALDLALAGGFPGFVAHQPEWSLARRNPGTAAADLVFADAATLALQRRHALPLIPYSAQAKGYFDKVRAGMPAESPAMRAYDSPANRAIAAVLASIADARGVTPTQVMLAYARGLEPMVIPIVGCYSPADLTRTWPGLSIRLEAAEISAIAAAAG